MGQEDMTEAPPYELPDDPGAGLGVTPDLDLNACPEATPDEPGDADTMNVDEPDEDTETGGV